MIEQFIFGKSRTSSTGIYYISNSGVAENTGLTVDDPLPASEITNLTLATGNQILFNKGETIQIDSIVIATDQITLGAYGSGADPILIGSTDLSGESWTDNLDGTYTLTTSEPKWVYIDNACAKQAETAQIVPTGVTETTVTVNHADVSGFTNIVGSTIAVRVRGWRMDKLLTVSAYNGSGLITLSGSLTDFAATPAWIQLWNDVEYFSADDEWVYRGGDLIVKSSTAPSTMTIRKGTGTTCIKLTGDACIVRDLDIRQYKDHGVYVLGGDTPQVTDCNFQQIRGFAVLLFSAIDGLTKLSGYNVSNNTIDDIGYNGITSNVYDSPVIYNNTISNIGMQANRGHWPDNTLFDMYGYSGAIGISTWHILASEIYSGSGVISYNTITNCGYNGVYFTGKSYLVHHNIVHDVMLRYKDGGAIYTWTKGTLPYLTSELHEIYYNIIYNSGLGANVISGEGTTGKGIYLDTGTSRCNVHHNVIYDVKTEGILCNAGNTAHTIEDNIVPDAQFICIRFVNNDQYFAWNGGDQNIGHTMNRNIFAVRTNPAAADMIIGWVDDGYANYPFDGGASDNNYFFNPYAALILTESSSPPNYNFATYKTNFGTDANSTSKTDWLTWASIGDTEVKLYTNETASDTTIIAPSGYEDVDGTDVSSQELTVPAYYGLLILKT